MYRILECAADSGPYKVTVIASSPGSLLPPTLAQFTSGGRREPGNEAIAVKHNNYHDIFTNIMSMIIFLKSLSPPAMRQVAFPRVCGNKLPAWHVPFVLEMFKGLGMTEKVNKQVE